MRILVRCEGSVLVHANLSLSSPASGSQLRQGPLKSSDCELSHSRTVVGCPPGRRSSAAASHRSHGARQEPVR